MRDVILDLCLNCKSYDCSIFSVNIDQLKKTQLELETLKTELLQEITMLRKANGKFVHSKFVFVVNMTIFAKIDCFGGSHFQSNACVHIYVYSLFGCFVLKLHLTFVLPVYLIHWQNC